MLGHRQDDRPVPRARVGRSRRRVGVVDAPIGRTVLLVEHHTIGNERPRFPSGDDRYPVHPRARGLGTAVVPRSLAEEAGDAVAILELAGVPARRTIALLWVGDRPQAVAPRTFVAFARDWLGAPQPASGTPDG